MGYTGSCHPVCLSFWSLKNLGAATGVKHTEVKHLQTRFISIFRTRLSWAGAGCSWFPLSGAPGTSCAAVNLEKTRWKKLQTTGSLGKSHMKIHAIEVGLGRETVQKLPKIAVMY